MDCKEISVVRIINLWLMVLAGWLFAAEAGRYVVVAHALDPNGLEAKKVMLEQAARGETPLARSLRESGAQVGIQRTGDLWVLSVGPVEKGAELIPLYFSLKALFPEAVVIGQSRSVSTEASPPSSSAATQTPPSSAHSTASDPTETAEQDTTIWIALFGLAIIGILYMFLSSDQLRRIKQEHRAIQERQRSLEVKQHAVLAQMGENIHSIAKETASHAHTLAEKTEGELDQDVQKVLDGENQLLGITDDLIKFLQIKSHKVTIQPAPFDLNNVLHEVAGTLQPGCEGSGKELVFDVAQDVPRMLEADSLHILQVLTGLSEHLMCHLDSHEVRLAVSRIRKSNHETWLRIVFYADVGGISEEQFFDAHYDESSGKYVGLGLFVAKELTELMGGELHLEPGKKERTEIELKLPVKLSDAERRQYHLPDASTMEKRVLAADINRDVSDAIARYLAYFHIQTDVLSAEEIQERKPPLEQYDILIIDGRLMHASLQDLVEEVRAKHSLKVVILENLYGTETLDLEAIADVRMNKPLTQQYVYDILLELYDEGEKPSAAPTDQIPSDALPKVCREEFEERPETAIEDFARFRRRHILVVEDNAINRKVLEGIFGRAGVRLSMAENGQEALERLEEIGNAVDLVLMDINMPVMDGFTATRRIHADPRWQSIPIVTLTALVMEHEIDKMFEAGANGYLPKPVNLGKLYHALSCFLQEEAAEEVPRSAEPAQAESGELNAHQALETMQENDVLYQEVLREFRSLYSNSDAVFERLIRDENYEALHTLSADLRGLTGAIGAHGLFQVVSQVLDALGEKRYSDLTAFIEPYRTELARLNRAINLYLP